MNENSKPETAQSIWEEHFGTKEQVPLNAFLSKLHGPLRSFVHKNWIVYILDFLNDETMTFTRWRRVYQLFGPLAMITYNVNALMETGCFFGNVPEDVAIKMLQIPGARGSIVRIESKKTFDIKYINRKGKIKQRKIRKMPGEGRPIFMCGEKLESEDIKVIFSSLNLAPYNYDLGKLRFFHFNMDSHSQAEELLRNQEVGSYILRFTTSGKLSLSYVNKRQVGHLQFEVLENGIKIGSQTIRGSIRECFQLPEISNILKYPVFPHLRFLDMDLQVEESWKSKLGQTLEKPPGEGYQNTNLYGPNQSMGSMNRQSFMQPIESSYIAPINDSVQFGRRNSMENSYTLAPVYNHLMSPSHISTSLTDESETMTPPYKYFMKAVNALDQENIILLTQIIGDQKLAQKNHRKLRKVFKTIIKLYNANNEKEQ